MADGGSGGHEEQIIQRPTCAACRHQRRKCDPGCSLRPYFRADNEEAFKASYKIFGISNMKKMVEAVEGEQEKRTVMDSIVWEATCWKEDPINGPLGLYRKLERELQSLRHQLFQINQHHWQQQVLQYAMPKSWMNDAGAVLNTNVATSSTHKNNENLGLDTPVSSYTSLMGTTMNGFSTPLPSMPQWQDSFFSEGTRLPIWQPNPISSQGSDSESRVASAGLNYTGGQGIPLPPALQRQQVGINLERRTPVAVINNGTSPANFKGSGLFPMVSDNEPTFLHGQHGLSQGLDSRRVLVLNGGPMNRARGGEACFSPYPQPVNGPRSQQMGRGDDHNHSTSQSPPFFTTDQCHNAIEDHQSNDATGQGRTVEDQAPKTDKYSRRQTIVRR